MAKKAAPEQSLYKEILDIETRQKLLEIERMQKIEKAFKEGTPMDILRASEELGKGSSKAPDRQTYVFDPMSMNSVGGYMDSPSGITLPFLRGMGRTPFVRAVIGTRQNQIARFSEPRVDMSSVGWTIKKKAGLFDSDKDELTDKDKKVIEGIMDFIINCGEKSDDKYGMYSRSGFETFMRETSADSLSMDMMAFECVENRKGELSSFVSVDGSTVRYADPRYYHNGKEIKPEALKYGHIPKYVQIYQNRIITHFYPWEMCLGIRNKTTDVRQNGYGTSELEDLVKIVTWQLFGDQYNGKFFSNGAAPKGILKVAGNVNQDKLNEFRMYWRQMMTGVDNAWRTPVLESDKIEWIDLQKSNQDMQFSNWSEYLVRIICAVYKIDSTEVGFVFSGGNSGQGDPHTSHKQRTDYSKDKGLYPLLTFYKDHINRYIVSRLTDKYEFDFTGVTTEDEESQLNNDVKRVSNFMTINEVREQKKLPPIPNGDIILNSNYIQAMQASMSGGMDSNEAVDEMYGSENPFDNMDFDDDEGNPFDKSAIDSINKWISDGMPETMVRIQN